MTDAFADLWRRGFHRLVPVTPPDATPSEKSTLAKRKGALGKAVGIRRYDGTWSGFDWLKHESTETDIATWAAMNAGTGIRTGKGLVALDIDTTDATWAPKIAEAARKHLGAAPVRIGRAPKSLLLYRTEDEIPYQRVTFDDGVPCKPGAEARVELLSEGRQFVAAGIHPATGKPYDWPDGLPSYDALPVVSAAQVASFFEQLSTALPKAKAITQGTSDTVPHQDHLKADLPAVRAAVAALPNTTDLFPTYADYISVGYAIKGALQDHPEEGLELFLDWCSRWDGENDPDVAAADWDRMVPPFRTGAGKLFALAEQHGAGSFSKVDAWLDDAVADVELNPFAAATEQAEEANRKPPLPPIAWINPADLADEEPPAREWEVEGFIPKGEVTLLYGDGGIGKTLIIHQYGIAAAAGADWLGLKTRPARVLAVLCEDSPAELHRRQRAIEKVLKIDPRSLGDRFRYVSRKADDNILAYADRSTGMMKRTPFFEQIVEDAVAMKADVVVIDTIADTFGGSEIDRAQVNSFVKACLGRLAARIGGSVIALGHPSVAGKTEGRSGSTGWSNAVRSRLFLRYPSGVEKGDYRELEGMKANYGPKGALLKLKWTDPGCFVPVAGRGPGIELNPLRGAGAGGAVASAEGGRAAGAGVQSTAALAERIVLEVLADAAEAGVSLSVRDRAPNYAPKVLKRLYTFELSALAAVEVDAALAALERRGLVAPGAVGKDNKRRLVLGYPLTQAGRTVLEGGALSAEAPDNLSEGISIFD